jgi:hypothetical protein
LLARVRVTAIKLDKLPGHISWKTAQRQDQPEMIRAKMAILLDRGDKRPARAARQRPHTLTRRMLI